MASRGRGTWLGKGKWLADAHTQLDAAVAAAYGWPSDITDDAALKELLERNQR